MKLFIINFIAGILNQFFLEFILSKMYNSIYLNLLSKLLYCVLPIFWLVALHDSIKETKSKKDKLLCITTLSGVLCAAIIYRLL